MMTNFPSWPHFAEDEIEAVTQVLVSGKVNYWTGDYCKRFEEAFAKYHDSQYAICIANGTLALELALVALEIQPGDEVIVPSRTFIASASAVYARGAKPIVADIDRDTQNISLAGLEQARTEKTKAIIVVHLAGWPCDMDLIMAFAKQYNLKVIEDCAQAPGAVYKGRKVGSLGDVAAFSFCQDKIMTTGGEGGMLVTQDETIWQRAWAYKDHGKSYQKVHHQQHPPGFRWLHDSFGSNFRMTEMQAAIGCLQLEKLPGWLAKRREYASILNQHFQGLKAARLAVPDEDYQHAYYKYYFFIRPEKLKPDWDRDRIMQAIIELGVPCFSGSCSEIYLEQAFETNNYQPAQRFPIAKELGETSVMLQVHPTLQERHIDFMGQMVKAVMLMACIDD